MPKTSSFNNNLNIFRRKCKHDDQIYRNQICDNIFQNMKSDAKTFWNLLKMNPLIKLN